LTDKIRDLDAWAEDSFAASCAKAGVTRNKSHQDRTGWDYLIEFPPKTWKQIPADLRPIESSARVQIKSKRSGEPSTTLKMSNALRFAKDPLPCFIILYLANDGAEAVRLFARHVWKAEIAQTLKRARKAHAGGRDDLHKLTITFSFSEELDDHSHDLLQWMAARIAEHGDRYAEVKASYVRTVGFEDGSIHGNIQFEVDDLQTFVDHQIGLSPVAPKLNITIKQRRFGIDAALPIFSGTPDVAHIQSHPVPCRVRIRGTSGSDEWLDGSLYLPAVPDLPVEVHKFRVVAEFVEIVAGPKTGGTVTLHLDGTVERSLPATRALTNVLRATAQGPIQIQVTAQGKPAFSFEVSVPCGRTDQQLEQLSNAVACLETASTGVLPVDLKISLEQIDASWNALAEFNGLIAGTNMKGAFTLASAPERAVGPATAIFLYDYLDIGGWTFLAVVRRAIHRFEIDGASASFDCGDPRVAEAIVRRGSGRHCLSDIQRLYVECVQREGAGVVELCGGDYRQMIAKSQEGPAVFHHGQPPS
jgi:hypothetical protein